MFTSVKIFPLTDEPFSVNHIHKQHSNSYSIGEINKRVIKSGGLRGDGGSNVKTGREAQLKQHGSKMDSMLLICAFSTAQVLSLRVHKV